MPLLKTVINSSTEIHLQSCSCLFVVVGYSLVLRLGLDFCLVFRLVFGLAIGFGLGGVRLSRNPDSSNVRCQF